MKNVFDALGDISQKVMAIVLAGGQGTRLYPLTIKRCKPAVAFGSRYRLIDIPISSSLNSGIRQIAVISQYFASELNQHIASTYRLDQFQKGRFELLCPEETSLTRVYFEGTADAVRKNLDHLLDTNSEYFLILSGDQLYNIDFRPMIQFAINTQADLVIASLPVKENEARRMGLLKLDENHRIVDFYEKPSESYVLERFRLPQHHSSFETCPKYLASMGIYVFKRSALVSILQEEGVDFGKHIIPLQLQRGKTYGFAFDGYWEDIGTIESYYQANLALTKQEACLEVYNQDRPIYAQSVHSPSAFIGDTKIKHSILGQGSMIQAKEVSNSIIGIGTIIGQDSIIRDSVILGSHSPAIIGKDCLVAKTIIDESARLGDHVRLINKNHLTTYDGDGIFLRDGIIIITSGTHLPDGFTF
ncbi:MAG: hypothetical protein KGZ30_00140 [Anaplasmataceae bacterium]|nr:hypothetical protein [Anaplasmataceae bacterium]